MRSKLILPFPHTCLFSTSFFLARCFILPPYPGKSIALSLSKATSRKRMEPADRSSDDPSDVVETCSSSFRFDARISILCNFFAIDAARQRRISEKRRKGRGERSSASFSCRVLIENSVNRATTRLYYFCVETAKGWRSRQSRQSENRQRQRRYIEDSH